MIDPLLHALATSDLPLSAEEIADVVWLASFMDTAIEHLAATKPLKSPMLPDVEQQVAQQSKDNQKGTTVNDKATKDLNDSLTPSRANVHLHDPLTSSIHREGRVRAASLRFPSATALPGKLQLARSLRPIIRTTPSSTRQELNEVMTAERTAEERQIVPCLQPMRERWLDVAVVIDDWHTMEIWQQTIAEFIEILRQLGAFRTLHSFLFHTKINIGENRSNLELYTSQGANMRLGRRCHSLELLASNDRTLVLVLSDCMSPSWRSGDMGRLLSQWGNNNFVTLVQMLPADLWHSCALADAIEVSVSAVLPGVCNARLTIERPWYWDDILDGNSSLGARNNPVPVITLDPDSINRWVQVMVGKGYKAVAFHFPEDPVHSSVHEKAILDTLTPEKRWRHFRATASPLAQELAGYLSAASLNLPVMRVIQRVMLPRSRQVHLAEILHSGLIEQISQPSTKVETNTIRYDFVEGIRDLLLTTVLLSDTQKVLIAVAEYLGQHNAHLKSFHALIIDPTSVGDFIIDEQTLPFANVAVTVLSRLGPSYQDLARSIEKRLQEQKHQDASASQIDHDTNQNVARQIESYNQQYSSAVNVGASNGVEQDARTDTDESVNRDLTIDIGESIYLPTHTELIAYLRQVQTAYARWADLPEPSAPLFDQAPTPEAGPDAYLAVNAKPLPMRLAEFRSHGAGQEAPVQELLAALGGAHYSVILGEPGSGKTTALERLAWVYANRGLAQATASRLVLPILARLTDYQGEADLLPLLRRVLNRGGLELATDLNVRATLQASDVDFVLLLDGLNEVSRQHADAVYNALRRHRDEFDKHAIHLTCRTADFDQPKAAAALASATKLWEVQPLTDDIRHWGDDAGASDVRDYLRRHLGDERGRRLYERLQADDRLHSLARLPLFLFMFKETAGDGDLPANRGDLMRRFVTSHRLLYPVPQQMRSHLVRSLECLAWRMAVAGNLEVDEETLYEELAAVRGRRTYELDDMRHHLQATGLLVALGEERYRLLHQMVQEYGAAAYLAALTECAERLPQLAQVEWWSESCVLALWLHNDLHTPAYLQGLIGDPAVDLRVRITAASILGQVGDSRFVEQTTRGSSERSVTYIEPTMIPIPAGTAILGGNDPDAFDDELPECSVPIAAFELAQFPVTNREYSYFITAGGYDDESLWTTAGQRWLRGEGKLDAEAEEQYRQIHRIIADDVEGLIVQLKRDNQLSEQDADNYRIFASWSEDQFVQYYNDNYLNEQRREPVWWKDSRFNGPTQPVVGLNWYEAMAYTVWLSQVTGVHYRLPTEAEWESGARRNGMLEQSNMFANSNSVFTNSILDRRYPWGYEWDSKRANSIESGLGQTNPVGVYPHGVTTDGAHELAGNVFEWTFSLYRPYPYEPNDGREDTEADGMRVCRGGSWNNFPRTLRCAYRNKFNPSNRSNNIGCRLVRIPN